MIDFAIVTSNELTEALRELEREAPRRVFRRVTRDIIPPLERQLDRLLRYEPPARTLGSPTFVWSFDPAKNARARRWFFANYPDGYTRTGAMAAAWESEISFDNGETTIGVRNDTDGASRVYGSEQFSQVPGHATTGWIPVAETIEEIGAQLEQDVEALWIEVVEEFI